MANLAADKSPAMSMADADIIAYQATQTVNPNNACSPIGGGSTFPSRLPLGASPHIVQSLLDWPRAQVLHPNLPDRQQVMRTVLLVAYGTGRARGLACPRATRRCLASALGRKRRVVSATRTG